MIRFKRILVVHFYKQGVPMDPGKFLWFLLLNGKSVSIRVKNLPINLHVLYFLIVILVNIVVFLV